MNCKKKSQLFCIIKMVVKYIWNTYVYNAIQVFHTWVLFSYFFFILLRRVTLFIWIREHKIMYVCGFVSWPLLNVPAKFLAKGYFLLKRRLTTFAVTNYIYALFKLDFFTAINFFFCVGGCLIYFGLTKKSIDSWYTNKVFQISVFPKQDRQAKKSALFHHHFI